MNTAPKEQKQEELCYLKLNQLVLSKKNVRTVAPSKEEQKILKASIKAQGIKQCLVVCKEGQHYGVIAGGCRLAQLNSLVEEGAISHDYLVPCMITEDDAENVSAISLSENIKAKMHPSDEFMAFQSMIDEGKNVVTIAHEFGITQKKVKERLKMAALAPELITYYREGKISLDDIMAFTVCDDHQRQLDCYNELKPHHIYPYTIKRFLLDESLSVDDPVVKFVSIKDYKKAGGGVVTDLFESSSYISDRELMESLAKEKLAKKVASLQKQWKWVECVLSQNRHIDYESVLTPEPINAPESITTAIQQKTEALDTLYDVDNYKWTDEHDKQEEDLENELTSLNKKLDKCRKFTEEQKQSSGVIIKLDQEGQVITEYGFVKKEDMALAFPVDNSDQDNTTPAVAGPHKPAESQALLNDLQNYKLQALQSHLMTDDKLAYDLMVFSMATKLLGTSYSTTPIDIHLRTASYHSTNGIDETKAAEQITKAKDNLELAWLSYKTSEDKFMAFRQLSSVQKKKILTYCTALSFQRNTGIDKTVSDITQFAIDDYWTPTAENYYKRVTTKRLLEIGKSEIGEEWEQQNNTLSKTKLVDELCQHSVMSNWIPESIK